MIERVTHMCRSGRSNRSKHGGCLPRLQSVENLARQAVLWVPPSASARAPNNAPERRSSSPGHSVERHLRVRSRSASTLGTGAYEARSKSAKWGAPVRRGQQLTG
jgi:hypothetical protein